MIGIVDQPPSSKLEKTYQEQEQDDAGDWFSNPTRSYDMHPAASSSRAGPHVFKKVVFGASMKEAGRQFQSLPIPESSKLIDRIQHGDRHRTRYTDRRRLPHDNSLSRKGGNSSHRRTRHDDMVGNSNGWYGDRDNSRDDGRRRDRIDRREHQRPRYTGGYSR